MNARRFDFEKVYSNGLAILVRVFVLFVAILGFQTLRAQTITFALPAYAPAQRIVAREFRLKKLDVRITEAQVKDQTTHYKNRVDFNWALRKAMKSFLYDGRDAESPLALAEGKRLRFYLNRPDTYLTLVDSDSEFPPENGEKVSRFWIFLLVIPSQSDHVHWAIVDRLDIERTYNYGFN